MAGESTMMDMEEVTGRMRHNADAIAALFAGVDDDFARWRPGPDDWSLLEVICHLYDEEQYDFRTRLDILLHAPGTTWPPIDPPGWVTERRYNDRDPRTAVQDFLTERDKSIAWLCSLESPNWSSKATSPWGRTMTAGQMMRCWLAHDMLHVRQMAEIHHRRLETIEGSAAVEYAGGW